MRHIIAVFFLFLSLAGISQVQPMNFNDYGFPNNGNFGAGVLRNTNSAAYLEVGRPSGSRRGFMLPRGNRDSVYNLTASAEGLLFYDLPTHKPWFWNGSAYVPWGSGAGSDSLLSTMRDVSFSTLVNGQILRYNALLSKWENWTPNFLTSFTETDPVWTSEKGGYFTKTESDARYLQSYTETDPIWTAASGNYFTKSQSDARYLQSYTETDPVWTAAAANYYTKLNLQTSGGAAVHWGNITNAPAFLTSYTETDPVWTAASVNYFTRTQSDLRYLRYADGLISGGIVTLASGMTLDVTAATYSIANTIYNSAAGQITLDAADPSNPRKDVIAVNTSGAIVKHTGIASTNPIEPQIDPATEVKLTVLDIAAGATSPTIPTNLVYDENVEWTFSTGGTITANAASTTRAVSGTKSILVSSFSSGSYIRLKTGTPMAVTDLSAVKYYLYLTASMGNNVNISMQLFRNNASVSNAPQLTFSKSTTGSWQALAQSGFTFTGTTFDEVRFIFSGSYSSAFNIDYVQVQGGYTTTTPGSFTESDPVFAANGVPKTRILSINGVALDLSQDRSWTISAGSSSLATLTDVSLSSLSNNQLLKYNSSTGKWENWTPNFLTSYTETDPVISSLSGVVIGNGGSAATAITGTAGQLLRRNAANTAYEFFTPGYLTSYTETDPNALLKANNLSDLTNTATARTNLGLAAIASSGSASDLTTGTLPASRVAGTATNGYVATLVGGVITWQASAGSSSGWSLTGNSGTNTANFIGTSDLNSVRLKTNNINNAKFDSLGGVTIYSRYDNGTGVGSVGLEIGVKGNTTANTYLTHSVGGGWGSGYTLVIGGPGSEIVTFSSTEAKFAKQITANGGISLSTGGSLIGTSPNIGMRYLSTFGWNFVVQGTSLYHFIIDNNGSTVLGNGGVTGADELASSTFTVKSTTKGSRPYPPMTQSQRDAISSPAAWIGLVCTDCTANDGSTGVLQLYNGSAWKNAW